MMWVIAPIMCTFSCLKMCPLSESKPTDYKNVFYSSYLPILSSTVFDDTGKPYDVDRILTRDFLFDRKRYENYSKVYLPMTYALSYAVQFAGLSALVTHTICWHGKDIWQQWKDSFAERGDAPKSEYQSINQANESLRRNYSDASNNIDNDFVKSGHIPLKGGEDVHNRLMRRYKDAPMSWYLITFTVMLAVGIFVVE